MDKYNFRGSNLEYGKYLVTDNLALNLYDWISWSLLGVGAFENVTKGQTAVYSGDRSRLRPTTDPRYTSGKVWQSHRGDWCWETGTAFSTDPIQVSGIWVNSTFYPTTGTTYPHYFDYPNGRLIFTGSSPATTSTIQVEYSPRRVSVRMADDPWFKSVMMGTNRVDDAQFSSSNPSGQWNLLPEQRVTLPVVIIEPTFAGSSTPYEFGNTSRMHEEDFLIHTITEDVYNRNYLSSIFRTQNEKRIVCYDVNSAPKPLNILGSPVSGAMTYPNLCESYPQAQVTIVKSVITNEQQVGTKVWWTTARLTLEVDLP